MATPDGMIDSQNMCSQAVVERVLQDQSVTSIKIYNNIQSDNYNGGVISVDPGTAGWRIERNTGDASFQNATIRGTLNADDIVAGTLDASVVTVTNIDADNINTGTLDASVVTVTNLNATNITTGTLSADRIAANSLAVGKISGGTYGNSDITFSSGSDLISSSYNGGVGSETGWKIFGDGSAHFYSADIIGTIDATLATLTTVTLDGTLTLSGSGTIQTAAGNERVVLQAGTPEAIVLADGGTTNGVLRVDTVSGDIELESGNSKNLYLNGDADLKFANSGTELMRLTSTGLEKQTTGAPHIRLTGAGSVSTPTYAFYGDTNTGIYRYASDNIGFATNGAYAGHVNSLGHWYFGDGATGKGQITDTAGSAASPTFCFQGDTNTGMLRSAADQITLACNGVAELILGTTGFLVPNVYNTDQAGGSTVYADSDGLLHINTSTLRHKTNVKPAPEIADIQLVPISFTKNGVPDLSFAAEWLADQDERLTINDNDGLVADFRDRAVLAVLAAKINRLEDHCGL